MDVLDVYMIVKGVMYIENLQFGIDLRKEKFNVVIVIIKDDVVDKDSMYWDKE